MAVGLKTLSFHFRLINGFDRSVLFQKRRLINMASSSVSHRGVAEGLHAVPGTVTDGNMQSRTADPFVARASEVVDEMRSDVAL